MNNKQKGFSDLHEWEAFLRDFATGDDRTCAILGASLLDHMLENLILCVFVQEDDGISRQLFEDKMPLGSLSAKIEIAYCLGLINKQERGDLNLIRRIRNEFAHDLIALRFADNRVRSRCLEFSIPREFVSEELGMSATEHSKDNPREIYAFAVFVLSKQLEIAFPRWARQVHRSLTTLGFDEDNQASDGLASESAEENTE